jgi:hypothetical protein
VLVFGSLFEGDGIMLPSICVLRWVMGHIFTFGMIVWGQASQAQLSSFVLYCAFS